MSNVQRPETFRIDYDHPLAQGLLFGGFGNSPGSFLYYDSSIYNSHGRLINPDSDGKDWSTKIGRSFIYHDGTDESINCDICSHHISSNITAAIWLYITDATIVSTNPIFGRYYPAIYERIWLIRVTGSIGIGGTQKLGIMTGNSDGSNYDLQYESAAINWNQLYHFAFAYRNGFGVSNIWIDGVSQSLSLPYTYTTLYGGVVTPLIIGGYRTYSQAPKGYFGDPVLYNRILGHNEIQQLADRSNVMLSDMILPAKKPLKYYYSSSPPTPPPVVYSDNLNIVRDCYWLLPSGTNYLSDEAGNLSTLSHGLYKSIDSSDSTYISFNGNGKEISGGKETEIYYGRLESTNYDPDYINVLARASTSSAIGCTANLDINGIDIGDIGTFTTVSSINKTFTLTNEQKERILNGRINDNYDYFGIKFYTTDVSTSGTKLYDLTIAYSGDVSWNNYETGLPGTDIKYFYPNKLEFRGGSIWYDQNNNLALEISYSGIDIDPTAVGVDTEYLTHKNPPGSSVFWTEPENMPSGGLSLYFDLISGPSGYLDPITSITRAQLNLRMSLPPSGLYENTRDTFEINGYNYRMKDGDYREDLLDIINPVDFRERTYGYFIYGAGSIVEQSGFKTYNVELNFLDPSLPSGEISSVKYRNIDIFNNMEFQLVGLPSGVQLSSAQLLFELIPNDQIPLYIPGGVLRSLSLVYPDSSGYEYNRTGFGGWHHIGNYDENETFAAFYDFSEGSGTKVYPKASGSPWTDAYGICHYYNTRITQELEPERYNYYRNAMSGASGSDYAPSYYRDMIGLSSSKIIDFSTKLSIPSTDFCLYFKIFLSKNYSDGIYPKGILFERGYTSTKKEIEIYIDGYNIHFKVYDIYGSFHTVQAPLYDESIEETWQPILVWISCYSTVFGDKISIFTHSLNNGYFEKNWNYDSINMYTTRQTYTNSISTINSKYSNFLDGVYICEFGVTDQYIDLDFDLRYEDIISYPVSSNLSKKFFSSRVMSGSYFGGYTKNGSSVNWIVPYGSGSVEWTTKYAVENWYKDSSVKHSIYNPVTTAGTNNLVHPSAVYIRMVTIHSTDHPSGVYITTDLEFENNDFSQKLARFNFNIPSGIQTAYIKTIDYHIGMNGEEIVLDDINNLTLNFKTKYVDIGSQKYNGDLSIKSLKIYFDSYDLTVITPSSGLLGLYTYGSAHLASGDLVSLYTIADHYVLNDNMHLFIEGLTPGYGSGNISFYTIAQLPGSGGLYTSLPLYTLGLGRDQYLPLYILAPTGILNASISLYINSQYDSTSGIIDLYIPGPSSVSSDGLYLYTSGYGITAGAIPYSTAITLFMARDSESADARLNLYMAQHQTISNFDNYICGHLVENSSINLYTYGSGAWPSSDVKLYTHGF